MQTDNYAAEYGRSGGAIVNTTTRSGTNTFHGGVYDYFRNTVLNAFGPFHGTGVKPTLVQNQLGGTFGGTILKDKLFFFVDYEGLRSVSHSLTTATLPTAAELTGLFTVDGTSGGTPIKNPYTGVVYANGQVPLNDPNVDPVALTTFKLLPTPNIPGAGLTAANYQYLPAAPRVDDKGDARVNCVRNDSQNGFFRYSQRAVTYFQPPPFPGAAGGNSNGTLYARTRQLAAGFNWTLTPSSISNCVSEKPGPKAVNSRFSLARQIFWPVFRMFHRIPPTRAVSMRKLSPASHSSENRVRTRSTTILPRPILRSITPGFEAITA